MDGVFHNALDKARPRLVRVNVAMALWDNFYVSQNHIQPVYSHAANRVNSYHYISMEYPTIVKAKGISSPVRIRAK